MRTPSSEMYGDLRSFGSITNCAAASILISSKSDLFSHVSNRPFLSRKITNAAPGSIDPAEFSNFGISTQTLFSKIISNLGGSNARRLVSAHYAGPAALNMQEALTCIGEDASVYANALHRINNGTLKSELDRDILYLHLYIACGCLQNASAAVESTEMFANASLAVSLKTELTSPGNPKRASRKPDQTQLGLIRVIGSSIVPPIHPLSIEPEGTVIGSISYNASDITDVGSSVSRRHLHIWLENGTWYARGLHSTNGTILISGSNGKERTLEMPRSKRGISEASPSAIIANGDILQLGTDTSFLVVSLAK